MSLLSKRLYDEGRVSIYVIAEIEKLENELKAAYLELYKQRFAITAVFDREVWNKADNFVENMEE